MYINTREFLKAVGDTLRELTWTPDGGAAEPVFQRVAYFDNSHAAEAVEQLLAFAENMAVIVPSGLAFSSLLTPEDTTITKTQYFDILFTGKSWDATSKAESFIGMIDQGAEWVIDTQKLGMLGMVEAVIDGLSGQKLAGSEVILPEDGEPADLAVKGSGGVRKSYLLRFSVGAGEREFTEELGF